jgi:iron complex outermembrane receptor protein
LLAGGAYANGSLYSTISLEHKQVDGWRDNSAWESGGIRARIGLRPSEVSDATLSITYLNSSRERPGPLPPGVDRSKTLTPYDSRDDRKLNVDLSGRMRAREDLDIELTGSARKKSSEEVLTVFSQTKDQDVENSSYRGRAGLVWRTRMGLFPVRVTGGFDAGWGQSEGRYYDVDPLGKRSTMLEDGEMKRRTLAGQAAAQVGFSSWLTCLASARYDLLDDEYTSSGDQGTDAARNSAFSPSLALNWRVGERASTYASVARSFKAPTLEQLFDRRPFFAPDPANPGEFVVVTLSNAGLKPQTAWNYETGLRIGYKDLVSTDLSLYWLRVKDEIGFDTATMSYENIDQSIHWGVEWGSTARLPVGLACRIGYTLTKAVFDGGEYNGNQINGVPEHILTGSLEYDSKVGLSALARVDHTREQFLDEGNRYPLDAYTTVSAKIRYRYRWLMLEAGGYNLFDTQHDSAGYLGQTEEGLPLPLYYPGRKRSVDVGIAAEF